MNHTLHEGDCRTVLPILLDASIDAVVCDPPYPCIQRSYGFWTVEEWFALMDVVVPQCRRVLKPRGSAVFILQPNSERVGRMRTWLWDFLAKWGREWGVVQDAYWWNTCAVPTAHCQERYGLMRPSVKMCVWLGADDCFRNQSVVLIPEARNTQSRNEGRVRRIGEMREVSPSGQSVRASTMQARSALTGGMATPFNVLPIGNDKTAGQRYDHGAGTPLDLMRWWIRYLCPPGGTVLDPFAGSGTAAIAAECEGRDSVLIEQIPEYAALIRTRLADLKGPLFAEPAATTQAQPSLFAEDVP